MKAPLFLIAMFGLAACGGKSKKGTELPPPDPGAGLEPTDDAEPEPEPEPEPPPPQRWSARAALAPVKGAKLGARVVTFTQVEGGGTAIVADATFAGLKAGKYHFVVHESPACGKNATKIGAPLAATSDVVLVLTVAKGAPGALEEREVGVTLDGEDAIVGHTLVLHEDKRGKPGKVVACGPIVMDAGDEEPAED